MRIAWGVLNQSGCLFLFVVSFPSGKSIGFLIRKLTFFDHLPLWIGGLEKEVANSNTPKCRRWEPAMHRV